MQKFTYYSSSFIKKLLFIVIGIVSISAFVYIYYNQNNKSTIDLEPYSAYVEAYTAGTISKKSNIRIHLANPVEGMINMHEPDERNLFKFSPSVKGKTYWIDTQTIEFRPEENFKSGKEYKVEFKLNEVLNTPEELKVFPFAINILKPAIAFKQYGLVSQNNTSLDQMKLTGQIVTSDIEEFENVEKILSVNYNHSLNIKWNHQPEKNTSTFTIDSIKKGKIDQELTLSFNGKSINADQKKEEKIRVPALNKFEILNIQAIQDQEDYALIQFSEPIAVNQLLDGLVTISRLNDLRYTIENSLIKVYATDQLNGSYTVNVLNGVENINQKPLSQAKSANIVFEEKSPQVILSGNGSILPHSNQHILPFDAINLKAVDVTIIKINESNIPQFFQTNNYLDGNDLRRVSKPILQKTIRLDNDKTLDLSKKNRFSIDLDKMIKSEPGAMYRVSLSFRKSYYAVLCTTTDEGISENNDESYEYGEKIDEDDSFWNKYNNYYPEYYNWSERDNPCTESYYTTERFVSRNILASNIGLIAKRGNDNSMSIIATNLLTTEPLKNISIELLDYQKQIIQSLNTNSDGIVTVDLKRKPFLLVAKHNNEKGYLKLDDASALPLSRFDIKGEEIQNGIKGFIYGERGVWRPGDSLYVSFILEDKLNKLPNNYPITLNIYNPKGQLYKKFTSTNPTNNFYTFKFNTESTVPTGNWLAQIKVGTSTFNKTLKIETVVPNRLKIEFNIGNQKFLSSKSNIATLSTKWLFGTAAQNLRAKVDVNLSTTKTIFSGYEQYNFDNPILNFESQSKTLFDGNLNNVGIANISTQINAGKTAPGVLQANFTTKVFEPGGNFSIDNFSIPYHVFQSYLGIKAPNGEALSGMLETNKNHVINIVNLNNDGKLLNANKTVQIELYKIQWRWWWEQDNTETFANFNQNEYNKLISKERVNLVNGKGSWNLRINEPDWGRYLILVRDEIGGHVSGKTVYLDWPGWAKREQQNNPTEASMLSFTSDKAKYNVGDDIIITMPSAENGRALISIENGSKVLKTFWTSTKKGQTQYKFKATAEMAPNVFANISLLQPHAQTINDLPIRMYGALPLIIENQSTILKPKLKVADKIKPEANNQITVTEENGKAMTYTIAIVDEGLLDLTRFKTPNAHQSFYAREGLGVKTWDLYDNVLGAYGKNIDRILSIGGDATINKNLNPAKANRFNAVVKFMGPFILAKGKSNTHKFKLPQYIGSVRVMLIAGQDAAYGLAEKTVQVKKPLMLLATLPRVIGPGEEFTLPVNVFATENNLKNVKVQLQASNLILIGSNSQQLHFDQTGEKLAYFKVKVPEKTGKVQIKINAQSGQESSSYNVELEIRNPNPYITHSETTSIQPGEKWTKTFKPIGLKGDQKGFLEISSFPPLNLNKHLNGLIQYPHGCVEQITSAAFAQLFLNDLTPLNEQQKFQAEKNIKATIQKLKNYQTIDGGFGYWPGDANADDWGSVYAAHFLVEAQNKGYSIAQTVLDNLLKSLKNKSNVYTPNHSNYQRSDLIQSYRLYVLALAKKPEIAAMNRLRAFEYLSISAKWRLTAAFKLIGQNDMVNKMLSNLELTIPNYNELGGTYGSEMRDEAMILETLTLLKINKQAYTLMQKIANKLSGKEWYSTQTTAYSLMAIAKFCGINNTNYLKYQYTLDNKTNQINTRSFFNSKPIEFISNTATVHNTSDKVLFARIVLEGQPLTDTQELPQNSTDILNMKVNYKLINGKEINPRTLKQGTDFYAEVTIHNPGKLGIYEQMALTQIFPSGWEIINTRLHDQNNFLSSSPATYQDVRDDRVFTYFNLKPNETVIYRVLLNAAYLGKFYLGNVNCAAMYNNNIAANERGNWVEVIK